MTVELIILCLVLLGAMFLYNFLYVQKGVAVPNVYTWNIVNLFDCITLKFSKIAHQQQEKLFRLICLVFKGYIVNDVDYAKQIYLLKNKFVMHPNTHAGFASLIPNAILSLPSSTPQWAAQHKVLSSCFTDKYLESTHNAMVESINRLVNKWTEEIQQSPSKSINRDVKGDIEELSMDILMNVLVGLKWGELSEGKRSELKDAINIFVLELYNRMNPMLPYRNTEKLRNAMKLLRDSVKETMVKSSAKEANKERNTMVSLLLQARENDEEMFSDAAVEDALLVLQFAAHETSTSGIIAALMAFADFKGSSDEMRNQFKDATPSVKEILGTRYVDNFVNEVLRYYPIIGITGRIATEEHTFEDGTIIPKDSFVFIPFYKFHKEKAIWGEDADQFVPERFNAKNSPHHKGHVFTPFGLGERQCLGKRLAQVELKIVSALLAQKFNFELTTKYEDLPMNQRISVQPETVPMKITLREELLQSSA